MILRFALSVILLAVFLSLDAVRSAQAANYYSAQNPDWPPLPANILGLPQTEISSGVFVFDDLNVDYVQESFLNSLESLLEGPPEPPGSGQGGGGGGGGNGPGGRTLPGTCSGYLLPPVYQTTNLVLSLTNVGGGETYDLFTAPYLKITNWTYLGRWPNTAATWVITNPPLFESYYFVACAADYDRDGLPDGYEAGVTHSNPMDQDTDYDGISDYNEFISVVTNSCTGVVATNVSFTAATNAAVFEPKRLAFFRFNDTNYTGDRGQAPVTSHNYNVQSVEAWATLIVTMGAGFFGEKFFSRQTLCGRADGHAFEAGFGTRRCV